MSIPGQNILRMASQLIAFQTLIYYKFTGRSLNSVGQDIAHYDVGVSIRGSFQPIQKKLYPILGLDLQKKYYNFYSSTNMEDINRDVSGDQFGFQGQRYQAISDTDWFVQDGWKGILMIHLGIDNGDPTLFGFGTTPSENTYVNFGHGNFVGSESPS